MPKWVNWVPTRGTLPTSPPWREGQAPVMFIHGTLASPGNFEVPARLLARRGIPFAAPAFGERGTGDVDASLLELLRVVDSHPAEPLDIVGHSLGGLLGLQIAQARPGRVRTLVGLGACYRGVPRRPRFPRVTRAVLGAAYVQLTEVRRFSDAVPEGTRVVSIVSDADAVVPASSSSLGEVVAVRGVRHERMPQLGAVIIQALDF